MKKYINTLVLIIVLFSMTLGAFQVFAKAYYFNGDSDLCQDLCESSAGGGYNDLWKCAINFPGDGDTASGYACFYNN